MPNWCNNDLEIQGKPIELEFIKDTLAKPYLFKGSKLIPKTEREGWEFQAIEEVIKPIFSFRNVIKPPNTELYNKSGLSFENGEAMDPRAWYRWNLDNWGTKWDLSDDITFIDTDPNKLIYAFETAWAPPVPVVEALAKEYPHLTIIHSYYEEGMGFYGISKYENGVLVETEEGDLSHEAFTKLERNCYCEAYEDEDLPFSDCPKENN
jgi:hypothetical protein